VPKEVNVALHLERHGWIRDLIFVEADAVDDREIPPMWRTINRIDAKADYQAALNLVLRAIGVQPAAAKSAPPELDYNAIPAPPAGIAPIGCRPLTSW
jgi:hypothetical protein